MPRKKKADVKEKVRLVRKCLEGKLSCTEAARQADVGRETIKDWIRWYEEEGINTFLSRKNGSYSDALKRDAVEDYLAGEGSQNEICRNS